MAKRTQNDNITTKLLSKVNSTWGAISLACTIFGFGVVTGSYVSDILKKIEITELNQKHNESLYNQKNEYDKQVMELIQQKNLLEIENGKLRNK